MQPSRHVTISRHWKHPEIVTTVTLNDISIQAPLDDFLAALSDELYQAGRWLTQAQLNQKLAKASQVVLSKLKEESAKAV